MRSMTFTTCAVMLILGAGCETTPAITNAPLLEEPALDRPFKSGTPAEIPTRSTEIYPNFFLVTGRGGNVLAHQSSAGLVLIDAKLMYPRAFEELLDQLEHKSGNREVAAAFMTHHHADHTGGNRFILNETSILIGHENAANTLDFYKTKLAPVNPSKPTIVFAEDYQTTIGETEIQAFHWGPGHTNGDIVIWFPDSKVVAVGDLVNGVGTLAVDAVDGQGSLLGMLDRVDDILALEFEILVPGHGANILTRGEVELYRDRLAILIERGKMAARQNLDFEKALQAMRSDDLGFRLVGHFWQDPRYFGPIFDELKQAIESEGDT